MGMYPGGNIVRVTPTVVVGTTHVDDVTFATTEIPNAVPSREGTSILHSIGIIDYDNEKHDLDIIFMKNNVSIGSAGSAPSWSDSDIVDAKLIGGVDVDWDIAKVSVSAAEMAFFSGTNRNANTQQLPMMVQGGSNSTSIYFTAITRAETDFAANNNLEFVFHFQYLG